MVGQTLWKTTARRGILAAADNRQIQDVARRYGLKVGASRFVAGETIDDAILAFRALEERGYRTNTTLLGEGVSTEDQVAQVMAKYETATDRIFREGVGTTVALKLSQIGLKLGAEIALENLVALSNRLSRYGSFIGIDMEDASTVDATLDVYREARGMGCDNIGVALQAYLHRTPADLERLLPLKPHVRVVKGAYAESASVALKSRSEIDAAYVRLVEAALTADCFISAATHDDAIIQSIFGFAAANDVPSTQYEIQMLYGVRPSLQQAILRQGHSILIATPFGGDWYPYLTRRIAERPANLGFFIRSAFSRG